MNELELKSSRAKLSVGYKYGFFNAACLVFLIQTCVGFIWMLDGSVEGVYLTSSGICMLLVLMPFIFRMVSPDPFSPLALAAFALLLGTGLRVPYVLFSNHERAYFLLFGQNLNDIVGASSLIIVGVATFTIGYCSTKKSINATRLLGFSDSTLSQRRVFYWSIVFAILGSISAYFFIKSAGLDLSQGLAASSRKVYIRHELGGGETASGTGGLPRFMVKAAEVAFITMAAMLVVGMLRFKKTVKIAMLLFAIPVFLVPFITSSRSSIALVIIAVLILASYYNKVRTYHLAVGLIFISMVMVVMGQLRTANMTGVEITESPIDTIIGSGNGLDFVRTAGIISNIPEKSPHMYGTTYLSGLTFFIPRSLWPKKPDVALGPWVKEKVFGYPVPGNNGWPAGTIAEAYINFGALGIPLVMFLYGLFCRIFYNSFAKQLGKNLPLTILYSYIIWRFGVSTFGLNIAHGFSQTLILAIPMLIFLYLTKVKNKKLN